MRQFVEQVMRKRLLMVLTTICALDAAAVSKDYFPPREDQGGWRSIMSANMAASPEQKAAVRQHTSLDWDKLVDA